MAQLPLDVQWVGEYWFSGIAIATCPQRPSLCNFVNVHDQHLALLGPQPSVVYGPVSGPLPARESQSMPFASQQNRQSARPRWENFRNNLGYLLRYSRKAQPGQCQPEEFVLFDRVLRGANSGRGRAVPGLCTSRRRLYDRPFGYSRMACGNSSSVATNACQSIFLEAVAVRPHLSRRHGRSDWQWRASCLEDFAAKMFNGVYANYGKSTISSSATYTLPKLSTATPAGLLNRAALP